MRYTVSVTEGQHTTVTHTEWLHAAVFRYAQACMRMARRTVDISLTDNQPDEHPESPRLVASASFRERKHQ